MSDVSDKVGVVLSELGEQEEVYANRLEEGRGVLKVVRDTERSVAPSREGKRKVGEEIGKLKVKEPGSGKLVTLEQELVRAEAENLVAEAQLGNVVCLSLLFSLLCFVCGLTVTVQTRQKLREAYTIEFLATIERAEKQVILARHGLRLLQLLDDTPVVPGDVRPPYAHASQARQILNDAEDDLREWRLDGGDDVVDETAPPVVAQDKGKGKLTEREPREDVDTGSVSVADTDGADNLSARI